MQGGFKMLIEFLRLLYMQLNFTDTLDSRTIFNEGQGLSTREKVDQKRWQRMKFKMIKTKNINFESLKRTFKNVCLYDKSKVSYKTYW